MVVPTADKMWYASLHQRLTSASATRGLVSLIRLRDCVVPTSGRNNSSRHAQKGLSMSKVSLEHSGVLLSCPLMRSGSPPRWIQIILSQLAQLPLAVKNRSKTIQLTGGGELHRACSSRVLARQTQQSFGTLPILSVAQHQRTAVCFSNLTT